MVGFDFSGMKHWQPPSGTTVLQADREALRLKLSPSGRVFVVTGDGQGNFTLHLENYQISQAPSFVMRTDSLVRIMELIGYKTNMKWEEPHINAKDPTLF